MMILMIIIHTIQASDESCTASHVCAVRSVAPLQLKLWRFVVYICMCIYVSIDTDTQANKCCAERCPPASEICVYLYFTCICVCQYYMYTRVSRHAEMWSVAPSELEHVYFLCIQLYVNPLM